MSLEPNIDEDMQQSIAIFIIVNNKTLFVCQQDKNGSKSEKKSLYA